MPLHGLVNWVIRGRLRTLLLCRPVGKRLITGNLVGRKTGGATPSLPGPQAPASPS